MTQNNVNQHDKATAAEVEQLRTELQIDAHQILERLLTSKQEFGPISHRLIDGETLSHQQLKLIIDSLSFTLDHVILRELGVN